MKRFQIGRLCVLIVIAASMLGCGTSKWEISAENKGSTPCTIVVSMNKGTAQSTINLSPGAATVFQEGTVDTLFDSVDVVVGGAKQTVLVNKTLTRGQRLNIVMQADGTVVTAVLPD